MQYRRIFTLLMIILILGAGSLCSGANIRRKQSFGRLHYNFNDITFLNKIQGRISGKIFAFRTNRFNGTLTKDKRKASFNAVTIDLCHPVLAEKNQYYISALDWRATLRPLLFPGTLIKHPVTRITLDMGHGGNDPGAIGKISREKDITLRLGFILANLLGRYGYEVVMTRRSDVKIPLNNVCALQRQHRSNLFISLHVNSTASAGINGIETFCLTPAGSKSSHGKSNKSKADPGNRYDANNLFLAYQIQRSLLLNTRAADRGVKRANFAVLRDINAPGVLVEVGFISNRREERLLNDPAYLRRIAFGIAGGVINYHRNMR